MITAFRSMTVASPNRPDRPAQRVELVPRVAGRDVPVRPVRVADLCVAGRRTARKGTVLARETVEAQQKGGALVLTCRLSFSCMMRSVPSTLRLVR
eukprot:SAG22_NODE_2483_length_2525_cov_5.067601_6_plen_96_part_00